MGENSCRSDCLSLRNKCCCLSFTLLLPSALLCLSLLSSSSSLSSLPPYVCLVLSSLTFSLPLSSSCPLLLPFLTLPPLSSSPFKPPLSVLQSHLFSPLFSSRLSLHSFSLIVSLPCHLLSSLLSPPFSGPLLLFSSFLSPLV